jgi:hypothetical protein
MRRQRNRDQFIKIGTEVEKLERSIRLNLAAQNEDVKRIYRLQAAVLRNEGLDAQNEALKQLAKVSRMLEQQDAVLKANCAALKELRDTTVRR